MTPIPTRLRKGPLIEAIWQAQFDAANAGDLLPGVLFAALRGSHPGVQMQRLPAADIPAVLTQADPNLRYVTKIRMEVPGEPLIWQAGDRVVALNCRQPYVGWPEFKGAIEAFIKIIDASGLVPSPLGHSLRYLDLLTLDQPLDLSALKLSMQLGDHKVNRHGLRVRVELPDDDCTHTVQIVTPADSNLPSGKVTGTLVDMETAPSTPPNSWDSVREQLEILHTKSKDLFFRQILTDSAIERMEPEYS